MYNDIFSKAMVRDVSAKKYCYRKSFLNDVIDVLRGTADLDGKEDALFSAEKRNALSIVPSLCIAEEYI